MIHTQPIIADTDTDAPHPSAQRAVRHMRLLEDLAEIGMDLARNVHRQALEPGDTPVQGDLGLTFSRISRAVRQTIALEARIDADQLAWATKRKAEQAEVETRRWEAREDKVERVVEQIIEAEAADAEHAEALFDDMCEHLDDEEVYEAYSRRPTGEIIALICKDLGLGPAWSLWSDEDWAADAERASAAGLGAKPSRDSTIDPEKPAASGGEGEMRGDLQASGPAVSTHNDHPSPAERATAAQATGPP